jgi:hypothetical protein
MKKLTSFLLILLLLLLCCIPAVSAASGFEIEDGVLLRYSGSAASVSVPEGVYAIAPSAFENNTNIQKVTLPPTVRSIGDRAFCHCTALSSVSGEGVTSVGRLAFSDTPYFENSVVEFFTLGKCLLWYNGSSAAVMLPSGIVSVAPYAFLRCDDLTSFKANDGLLSIGEGAFYECGSLASVTLPATVTDIGAYAFDGTAWLKRAGDYAVLGDGILIRCTGAGEEITLPNSIRRIAPRAFCDNTSLKSVKLPSSVYSVDSEAFRNCTALTTLGLSFGLVNIGDYAFAGCTALTKLMTPASLSNIGSYAFSGDTALVSASIGGSRLTIAPYAFSGCAGLQYALLSSGVSEVDDYAFSGCTKLGGISFTADTMIIGRAALDNCPRVTVVCPEGSFAAGALSAHTVDTAKGDADLDGMMTIIDATRIQRYLAGTVTISARDICSCEMDGDGCLTVLDVTRIQRILAGLA